MKVLLDTNIIIHREAYSVSNISIGQLFRWLDQLKYIKCIHPITVEEITGHNNANTSRSMGIKLEAYHTLKTIAPFNERIKQVSHQLDKTPNDRNDSALLNEVLEERVDVFITEDRKIHHKASLLAISDKVFTIASFVEKCVSENPELTNYKVLSIQKAYFGSIDINDAFFDSFREDYFEFNKWFNRKSDETAYVSHYNKTIIGFLYIKLEGREENYSDINPSLTAKKRLKIGTFKVALNGYRIGERFLKIIFDNALQYKVEEIYVTIFDKTPEQLKLIELLEDWGFAFHGTKDTKTGTEKVYVRQFKRIASIQNPKTTFPYISKKGSAFLVPIFPDYHTELLPDSILRTESPKDFIESQPHRNALSKVYISHSYERNLKKGDIIIFYRTGGYHYSVVTTIGIVETVFNPVKSLDDLQAICRKKTFFTKDDLAQFWNKYKGLKPFVVEFLYAYSFPKRPNLAKLIELRIIKDINSAPRGFSKISWDDLHLILKESNGDESIVVDQT